MKKGLVLMMILLSMNFIISCFISDCPEPSQYYLIDVNSKAFDGSIINTYTERHYVDTLKNQLAFESTLYIEFANALQKSNHSDWLNVAYGCVNSEILNPIDTTKSSFSTNRTIGFETTSLAVASIEAQTNLLQDERIKDWIVFPNNLNIEQDAITVVDLDSELLFENGLYEFYFKWETFNGDVIRDTVNIVLEF